MKLKKSYVTLAALVVAGILLTVATSGLLNSSKTVPLTGTITTVNVDVYSDSQCAEGCTSLNVGTLDPGDTANQTIFIKNTGSVPETLTMTVGNWTPVNANASVALSWNRQNYVLNPGEATQAILTLTVCGNATDLTTFSCDVIIIGTQ
jgi:hypothetical protein